MANNIDDTTVAGFGQEWATFDQAELPAAERQQIFDTYFSLFPFAEVAGGEGFDLGCGSGRWAGLLAPRVKLLHCIDASSQALEVARGNVGSPNVAFHRASVDAIPLPDGSQDFGFSLGVLHHVPDTAAAIEACARKLRPGAPFLIYLAANQSALSRASRTSRRVAEGSRPIGGTGNDALSGDGGNDTFVFNSGDGQDTIRDYGLSHGRGGNDTLLFGTGIASADVTLAQADNGNDLVLSINGTTDRVTFDQTINDGNNRIEQVQLHRKLIYSRMAPCVE